MAEKQEPVKAGKVTFQHSTRMRRGWDSNGTPITIEKNSREEISRVVAEKWQRMGLGKIIGEGKPIEARA